MSNLICCQRCKKQSDLDDDVNPICKKCRERNKNCTITCVECEQEDETNKCLYCYNCLTKILTGGLSTDLVDLMVNNNKKES